jgi:hypothetical protein
MSIGLIVFFNNYRDFASCNYFFLQQLMMKKSEDDKAFGGV